MKADQDNLRRFAQEDDHGAFAEIVRRYIDLVWATGFRVTGDADLARDVAQSVFVDLARKAGRLPENTVLAGWLHRAASFAAHRAVRNETRRRLRERLAMELESLQANEGSKEELERLLPVLDEAIAALRPKDRDAVVLRFFGKKSLAEIGATFGVSEDAAQKRLMRALDRMRVHFQRRGLEASSALVLGALGAAGAQAAPAGMAVAVSAGSIAAAGAATAGLATSWAAHAASALALMKTPIVATALVAAVVTAPIVYQERERSGLAAENAVLAAQAAELPHWREVRSQTEAREELQAELARLRAGHDELVKLRAELAALRTPELDRKVEWQNRLESARAALSAAQARSARVEAGIQAQDLALKRVDDLKKLGLAARVWAADNDDRFPSTLRDMTNEIGNNVDFDVFVEPYEYYQHGRPVLKPDPNLILFREKQPRRLPDGTWTRAYTLMDGSVQQIGSPTGDFSEWEGQHTLPPVDPALDPRNQ